jgi:DNA-binding response OmpR family regulator
MKRILVADDEIDIVTSIKEMLDPYYFVETATTAVDVLRKVANEGFDGLIIDVDFGPGMSGLEVASVLRNQKNSIPILIFSAIDYSSAVRQQVVDLGATFCEKPLGLDFVMKVFA